MRSSGGSEALVHQNVLEVCGVRRGLDDIVFFQGVGDCYKRQVKPCFKKKKKEQCSFFSFFSSQIISPD
ncbi:hypothetical protein DSQ37_01750 [Ureaplasma urealyticum]|nr:hypothetical protein DSQ37_01750 [Ureaplasma urealyticum]